MPDVRYGARGVTRSRRTRSCVKLGSRNLEPADSHRLQLGYAASTDARKISATAPGLRCSVKCPTAELAQHVFQGGEPTKGVMGMVGIRLVTEGAEDAARTQELLAVT
ncbi:uncharacterized protein LOC142557116 [Dermacentor variabilis]|uniref:uncharacterized protein LOC142557116 n=1 Tax=Dermacentor variabilis TaxID=34621 RepID=UPI003F5CBB7D